MDWGVSGPNLRACGLAWDLRKAVSLFRYDQFSTSRCRWPRKGDCYARYLVRVAEMRQSLKIIAQAAAHMPPGASRHRRLPLRRPPRRDMLNDIESLIHHFINVTRGPGSPGERPMPSCEIPRGEQGYYVWSATGWATPTGCASARPVFANVQVMPLMATGWSISDLIAIIGSVDYILPDIDR
jgi:NADH:ubiquinone oxidoreductase subunit D